LLQPPQVAFWMGSIAYMGALAFWLWAAFSWLSNLQRLPATKDACDALSKTILNKGLLTIVFSVPAGAVFGLVKTLAKS